MLIELTHEEQPWAARMGRSRAPLRTMVMTKILHVDMLRFYTELSHHLGIARTSRARHTAADGDEVREAAAAAAT
jgi:hypothetical protein